jgi:hypothetical protein
MHLYCKVLLLESLHPAQHPPDRQAAAGIITNLVIPELSKVAIST